MQTLGTGEGKPVWLEKVIRIGIPAGIAYACVKLFNAFAPDLITFFDNFWHIVLVGGPAVMLVLYVLQNPQLLWMGYKTLCRKLTSLIIKMDPLSFMDRYVDMLKTKRKGLQESKVKLEAKKIELEREIKTLKASIDESMRKAKAAATMGDKQQAADEAEKAVGDKNSVELYLPIYNKMCTNLEFLEKLNDNWGRAIEKLSYTVERKRKEFLMLKETAKALGMAKEFAQGDTEANRIYKESVIALEENVTQKLASIEEFEQTSKGAMKSIDIEKQMNSDEGLELLEQYMQKGSVFLNEDYSKYEIKLDKNADLFDKASSSAERPPKTKSSEYDSILKK